MILLVFFVTLSFVWYWQNWSHPKRFPPGPRLPIPIIGDAYTLDKDLYKGLCDLVNRYGNFCGLWFGGNRVVIINDYEACLDILNRNESTVGKKWQPIHFGVDTVSDQLLELPFLMVSLGQLIGNVQLFNHFITVLTLGGVLLLDYFLGKCFLSMVNSFP